MTAASHLAGRLARTRNREEVYELAMAFELATLDLEETLRDPVVARMNDAGNRLTLLQISGEVVGLDNAARFLRQVVDRLRACGDADACPVARHVA